MVELWRWGMLDVEFMWHLQAKAPFGILAYHAGVLVWFPFQVLANASWQAAGDGSRTWLPHGIPGLRIRFLSSACPSQVIEATFPIVVPNLAYFWPASSVHIYQCSGMRCFTNWPGACSVWLSYPEGSVWALRFFGDLVTFQLPNLLI